MYLPLSFNSLLHFGFWDRITILSLYKMLILYFKIEKQIKLIV